MKQPDLKKSKLLFSNFLPEYRNKAGLFLCLGGSAEVVLNNRLYRLKRGTLYIVSPLVPIYKVSQSDEFDGFHILDDLEVFYPVVRSSIDTILRLKLRDTPCLQLSDEDMHFIIRQKELIAKKKDALQRGIAEEEAALLRHMIRLLEQEIMLEVISIFYRTHTVEPEPVEKNESLVYEFISLLHQHYKTQRTVAFYAAQVNLSPGHFSFIVKQKTGQTPLEWIIDITIINAKVLLEQSNKSIKEIAAELNFPEQFTFGKYFKQYTGLSPRQYRVARKSQPDTGEAAG